ncbi:hypothetical protein HY212_02905 [Candidatus Pacearchaeota archaeon]|nr:hypothetical protein [Candidatus Pacearchaeota archaeon]
MRLELTRLAREADSNGDQTIKFDDFLKSFSKLSEQENNFARKLFGDSLDAVVENTLEFYREYQPTRPLFSCSNSKDYVEGNYGGNDRYIITDVTDEWKKRGINVEVAHKVEEVIKYTPKMMLKDVEYNAKIAYVLSNVVGSRGVYEIGAGNGVLALGLSILTNNRITTIESDPYYVELQRNLRSKLVNKIKGELIIEDPIAFGAYVEKNKISSRSFLVCNRGDWNIFDEVVNFGINNSLDMLVSRDFHKQSHMLGPIESTPLGAYKHVKEIIFNITRNSVGHQIIMTRKDLCDEEDHTSHFNEFLIKKLS